MMDEMRFSSAVPGRDPVGTYLAAVRQLGLAHFALICD